MHGVVMIASKCRERTKNAVVFPKPGQMSKLAPALYTDERPRLDFPTVNTTFVCCFICTSCPNLVLEWNPK